MLDAERKLIKTYDPEEQYWNAAVEAARNTGELIMASNSINDAVDKYTLLNCIYENRLKLSCEVAGI